ncbi:MAG: hypothetical protein EOP90_07240 [Lysobacteraceae bacterium]|nr:MAG: hypothetical protein EOP90_07240 [Xanthomonadaceae bacterium]
MNGLPRRSSRGRPCLVALLVSSCAACSAPPAADPVDARARPAGVAAPRARFVDVDWRVVSSSAVAVGTRYRFAADGGLRIDVAGSPPGIGRWSLQDGAFVMIEEGIAYPTEILRLDEDHFTIRSHNPGTPVDIEMVRDSPR